MAIWNYFTFRNLAAFHMNLYNLIFAFSYNLPMYTEGLDLGVDLHAFPPRNN